MTGLSGATSPVRAHASDALTMARPLAQDSQSTKIAAAAALTGAAGLSGATTPVRPHDGGADQDQTHHHDGRHRRRHLGMLVVVIAVAKVGFRATVGVADVVRLLEQPCRQRPPHAGSNNPRERKSVYWPNVVVAVESIQIEELERDQSHCSGYYARNPHSSRWSRQTG